MSNAPLSRASLASLGIALLPSLLLAQSNWTGATSNEWNVGSNWSGGAAPAAGDPVFNINVATGLVGPTNRMVWSNSATSANIPLPNVLNIGLDVFEWNGETSNLIQPNRWQQNATTNATSTINFTATGNADDAVFINEMRLRADRASHTIAFNNVSAGRVLIRGLKAQADDDPTGFNDILRFSGSRGFKLVIEDNGGGNLIGNVETSWNNVQIDMNPGVVVEWGIGVVPNGTGKLSFSVTGGILQFQGSNLLHDSISRLSNLTVGPNGKVVFGGSDRLHLLGGNGVIDIGANTLLSTGFAGGTLSFINYTEGMSSIQFDGLTDADFAGFTALAEGGLLATSITLDGFTAYLQKTGGTTGVLTAIPEPGAIAAVAGLGALLVARRRRRA